MRTLNRAMLIGHLGNKPEKFTSQTGKIYCRLNVATHRSWREEDGKWTEKTDWHYVVVWGFEAEKCIQYLQKGSLVFVEGTISSFEKEPGSRMTRITADSVQFLKIAPAENPVESATI